MYPCELHVSLCKMMHFCQSRQSVNLVTDPPPRLPMKELWPKFLVNLEISNMQPYIWLLFKNKDTKSKLLG